MSYRNQNSGLISTGIGLIATAVGIAAIVGVLGGTYWAWKNVQVWAAEQNGRAVLAEAEFSRQARVEEARAKANAAELEGQAELTRAEFAAQANAALAEGLGGPEAYLRYLYIRMLEEQGAEGSTLIYIPTEAGVPILEAGRGVGQ
jgi:regulator of protease activity HflC (stomatin/prohibitin superfamily)